MVLSTIGFQPKYHVGPDLEYVTNSFASLSENKRTELKDRTNRLSDKMSEERSEKINHLIDETIGES